MKTSWTRRHFLKATAGTGAGMALRGAGTAALVSAAGLPHVARGAESPAVLGESPFGPRRFPGGR